MLKVDNLKKRFGDFEAVKGISFAVKKGEVLGFLGPNGAGKSTTMRMITGFIPPTSGTAAICGHDIIKDPIGAKACLGYLPENAPSYRAMTVTEFLTFVARIRGFRGAAARAKVDEAIDKAKLESVAYKTIDTLSKGYRQRTCFAQAILHDPQVLIMDEPTDGLDPNQKFVVRNMIKEMAAEKAIIISTHILEEVDAVCTRALVIANGEIKADGTPDELRAMDPSGKLDVVFHNLTMEKEFRREFKSYFDSPVAYVFLVAFLVLVGFLTFGFSNYYERGQAVLTPFFIWHPWVYLLLVPAATMGLWAEERRNGTIELLLTMPLTLTEALLGKFLAAWAFIGVGLALTFPILVTTAYLGNPDWGAVICGYVGSLLLAGAASAIGVFASSLSRSQVVGFVVALAILFGLRRRGLLRGHDRVHARRRAVRHRLPQGLLRKDILR